MNELKFTFKPESRLVGGNHKVISSKPVPYKVDLTVLRDGYRGRSGSQPFRGAVRLGTALGLAIRNYIENESLAHTSTRNVIRAAYEFMRFLDDSNIPDQDTIDWDMLVDYQDYLAARLKADELHSAIPKFYSTIASLAQIIDPNFQAPASPFFTEKVTSTAPSQSANTITVERLLEKSQKVILAAFEDFEEIEARFEAGKRYASGGHDPRCLLTPEVARRASRSAILKAYTLENTLHLLKVAHDFEPVGASEFEDCYGVRTDYLDHGCGARGESNLTGMAIIQNWILPTFTDLVAPFMFCNEFIGMNEGAMLSLRSSTVSNAVATARDGVGEIWCLKGRSTQVQRSPVISRPPFGPLDVLAAVNRWTEPLRSKLTRELNELRRKRAGNLCEADRFRIDWLEAHVDQLWLAFDRRETGRVAPLTSGHLCARQYGALLINHDVMDERYTNRSARTEFAMRAEAGVQEILVSFLMNHKKRETTDRHYRSHRRQIAEIATAHSNLILKSRKQLRAVQERCE